MTQAVVIDGVLLGEQDAKISVYDRGFLYGDSVFETIRTYAGRPFQLSAHLERLERSAGLVFIPLPVDRSTLSAEIEIGLRAAGNAESYVRVMLTRGQGTLGLDPALAERPCRVIIVAPLQPLQADVYDRGVGVRIYATQRTLDATGREGAKVGNYLLSVLALREAKAIGAHEALIADGHGRVVEGATSNVFYVRDGVLHTPPVDAGILPGITRAQVLLAAERLGIEVRYATPTIDELKGSDEVAISSSIRELVPVVSVDGEPVGAGRPGVLIPRLLAEFRRLIGSGA
jgi:branched-chain amino acid aminotransferase